MKKFTFSVFAVVLVLLCWAIPQAQTPCGLSLSCTGTTATQTNFGVPYVTSGGNTLGFLTPGAAGTYVRSAGTGSAPTYDTIDLGTDTSGNYATSNAEGGNALKANDLNITSQAQGDVIYFNGTIWTRLAAGAANTFLRSNGAGQNPSFAVPATSTTVRELDGSPSVAASIIEVENGRVTDQGGGVARITTVDPQILTGGVFADSGSLSNDYVFFGAQQIAGHSTLGGNGPGFPPGTLKHFGCSLATLSVAVTVTCTVHKNAVATSMACTTASGTSGSCADTTNTVTTAAGDGIAVRITQSGASSLTTDSYLVIQAQFIPS